MPKNEKRPQSGPLLLERPYIGAKRANQLLCLEGQLRAVQPELLICNLQPLCLVPISPAKQEAYMAAAAPFIPAQPPRVPDWLPGWHGLFGERLRSAVYGIAEPAFDVLHKKRRFLNMDLHIVNDPDMIGHVLLDNHANYVRPRLTRQILEPAIGNGLLTASGEDWRKQRRIVAPTFSPQAVFRMASIMDAGVQQHVARLPDGAARVDMARVATETTMTIIANTLFSGDARLTSADAVKHFERVLSAIAQPRLSNMFGLQEYDPSPSMIRMRRSRRYLRESMLAMVRERGPNGGGDDFFGNFIRAIHSELPPGEAEILALDNALTFYGAGHETTATAVTWAIYLLAGQPDLQGQARREVMAVRDGDAMTLADQTPLLRQILEETMRLYPSAAQIVREAADDDDMLGVPVKKGELVFIYPWILHRHRTLWERPDDFDHTRWTVENKAKQHRFQYIPFGAGPRICVGMRFAMVEALIILSHWLTARRFSLPPGLRPIAYGNVTLRPKEGMPLLVEPI
jgi:cytochrome P450